MRIKCGRLIMKHTSTYLVSFLSWKLLILLNGDESDSNWEIFHYIAKQFEHEKKYGVDFLMKWDKIDYLAFTWLVAQGEVTSFKNINYNSLEKLSDLGTFTHSKACAASLVDVDDNAADKKSHLKV